MLWCCKRQADDVAILDVHGTTPEHGDIERLCDALNHAGGIPHVVIDLSTVNHINSLLMARLVLLNKRVRAAKGELILCGLNQFARDTLRGCRLDRVFDICDNTEAALATH